VFEYHKVVLIISTIHLVASLTRAGVETYGTHFGVLFNASLVQFSSSRSFRIAAAENFHLFLFQ